MKLDLAQRALAYAAFDLANGKIDMEVDREKLLQHIVERGLDKMTEAELDDYAMGAIERVQKEQALSDPTRRRPYKPDIVRVERGDYVRVSHLVVCDVCGYIYGDHAPVNGYEWLTRLCDGRLVKL